MSEIVITLEDAASRLPELVEHVHAQREAAVIVKSGRPIVRIVPVPVPGESSEDLIAFLGRWRRDYPEPDDGLAEAIEESRRAVQPPRNPFPLIYLKHDCSPCISRT
jgi:antitoxin (DNA-binding transcriptional repressor) of toxin-antitoxin stability system